MLWVGRAGAVPGPTRDSASTAKLEVGGVEGAGVSPFFTPGARPVDQFAGKLSGRHPDRRLQPWILRREFRLEARLSHIHRQPRLMAETRGYEFVQSFGLWIQTLELRWTLSHSH
jgi:hypothetical protein